MQTVTVDILNEKAYRLLEDLEALGLIRVQDKSGWPKKAPSNSRGSAKFNKTVEELEEELRQLRTELKLSRKSPPHTGNTPAANL